MKRWGLRACKAARDCGVGHWFAIKVPRVMILGFGAKYPTIAARSERKKVRRFIVPTFH